MCVSGKLAGFLLALIAFLLAIASDRLAVASASTIWMTVALHFAVQFRRRRQNSALREDWIIPCCLALLIWSLFANRQAILPEVSLNQTARLLAGIGLIVLVARAQTPTTARWTIYVLLVFGALIAFTAPISVDWFTNKITLLPVSIYQAFSVLTFDSIHPNVLAGILIVIAPFAICLTFCRDVTRAKRLMLLASSIAMLTVIAVSQSRGGMLACVMSLLSIVLNRLRLRRAALLIAFSGLVICILLPLLHPQSAVVFPGFARTDATGQGITNALDVITFSQTAGTASVRYRVWRYAQYIVWDFPVWGTGFGAFQTVTNTLYPFFTDLPHAHNLILQIALDLGLPGCVLWILIFLQVVLVAHQYTADSSTLQGCVASAALASMTALIVHGWVDASLWGMVRAAPLVWIVMGIALSLPLIPASMGQREVQVAG
jgi:putative inorganic carbon (hco3(-)) transporter